MSTINLNTLFGRGGNAFFLLYYLGQDFPGKSKDLHICFRANPQKVDAYVKNQAENPVELCPLHTDLKNNPWDAHRLISYWLQVIFRGQIPEAFSRVLRPERCFALEGDDVWSYNLVLPWDDARELYGKAVSDTLYLLPGLSEESLPHLFPQRTWLLDLVQKGFEHIRAHTR